MRETDLVRHRRALAEAAESRLLCKIERDNIDDSPLYVYPLAVIGDWCVAGYIYDLRLDGYVLFRIRDVTSMVVYPEDDFYSQMLVKEGVKKRVDYRLAVLESRTVQEALGGFAQAGEIVIAQCEGWDEFFIGRIKKVNKAHILFHYFDADGLWAEALDKISLSDVTLVKFRGNYETVYAKYVPPETDVETNGGNIVYLSDR